VEKDKVYEIFFNQSEIKFNKGYKMFEEVYEELKNMLHLKKIEDNSTTPATIIIKKGE